MRTVELGKWKRWGLENVDGGAWKIGTVESGKWGWWSLENGDSGASKMGSVELGNGDGGAWIMRR